MNRVRARATMRDMRARIPSIAAILAATLFVGACAKTDDAAAPVAAVSVTPSTPAVDIGAPIELIYQWTRVPDAPPLAGDLWAFVHLVDTSGMLLWTDDHRPPVSPSQWGTEAVTYRRTVFVPRVSYTGEVRVKAGLYAPGTGERVPLTGAEAGDRSVAASVFTVRPPSNPVFVAFGDGWHGAERAPQEPLREWRWSAKDARLSFRSPGNEATLWLELDQPVAMVGKQRVELRHGSALLAAIDVVPGARSVSAIPLRLGAVGPVDLDVHVEPTFVPAAVPSLGSQDTRQLGVRVFNVYVALK